MPDLSDLNPNDSSRLYRKDKPFLKLGAPLKLSSLTITSSQQFSGESMVDCTSPESRYSETSSVSSDDSSLSSPFESNLPQSAISSFSPKTRAVKPKLVFRQSMPRHTPPSLSISPTVLKPHFVFRKNHRSAQASLATVLHPWSANLYASRFPTGHTLDADFVSKYAPGAELGSGAYGFVATVVDVASNQLVAVKFIEKHKIQSWGWYNDPDFGRVPKEVAFLRMLDHPGIIKFIELFQDSMYFYVVQELHGSPWCSRESGNPPSKLIDQDCHNNMNDTLKISQMSIHHVDFDSDTIITNNIVTHQPTRPSPISSSSSTTSSESGTISLKKASHPPLKLSRKAPKLSYDLFECIEQHSHFSEFQARYIFRQIVDVVHYLDELGIYHRDIKDENILIDSKYHVKLVDFGSAVQLEPGELLMSQRRRPYSREFRGTLAYAPPEILSERNAFHQVDAVEIWSLGLLLGFLLVGRNLFPTREDVIQGNMRLPNNCIILTDGMLSPIDEGTRVHRGPSSSTTKAPAIVISSLCYDLLTHCLSPNPMTRLTIAEVKAHPWLHPEYL